MKNKLYLIGSAILVSIAIFLRFNALGNRAPFDWDQNRDYQAISQIASGKPILIGPVVKGEGGFFLGPLYYYLVIPAFILTHGSPLALPATSAALDVLTIIAVLLLLPRVFSHRATFVLASIWTYSFFAIEASHISWNVVLLPLFSVLLIYLAALKSYSRFQSLLFGLLLGFSWHIHASLIFFGPLFVIALLLSKRLQLKQLPLIVIGYILPLLPLLIFDLRHNFLNLQLLLNFGKISTTHSVDYLALFTSVFSRFGKNIYSILLGSSDLHLWWGIGFTTLTVLALLRGTLPARISGLIVLLNILLVIALREIGFPEYYFGISYLPSLIILLDLFDHFPVFSRCALTLTFVAAILVGYRTYTTELNSYSLGQKQTIVQAIAARSTTIDLRYELPIGRESGFELLLPRSGVQLDSSSPTKVIISEKMGERLFFDGEPTNDLGYFGGMHVGIRVVQ